MPSFAYTARDSSGGPVSGTLAADSIGEVQKMLRAEGKYPTSVRPAGEGEGGGPVEGANVKIRRDDLIQIATQLSIMIETGVTLTDALDCIAKQSDRPNVTRVVQDLAHQVQGGSDFSSALARHPRSFPRLFVALIKASEKSGMLSRLLTRATNYLRDEQDTTRRVKGALTYPAIMLAFALSSTTFLLAFVLPKFTAIYAAKQAALPVPTKVLMLISQFIIGHYIALPAGIVSTVFVGYLFFSSEPGARCWHWMQLRLPLMGSMYRKLHLSRGLRMVGTLAGAGVNLLDCVSTARDLCANVYYRELWESVSEQIQAGRQLSEPLFQNRLVPRPVAQMINSGEKGGKLAQVMEQVAGYSEQQLKEQIADMTRYIEPAMIIVMGFIIGGVALALLLPIFTISRVITAR